ncbi:MAG TPA: S24 family peptidase [Terriglobales bacterium]|nr:S24 family peptidase [Terriglobales bacterium]
MVKDFRGLQERLRERLLAEIAAGELTGLELARRTGFRQAHISNFLNRKRGLSLQAMDVILKARGLTVTELFPAKENRPARARTIHAAEAGGAYIPLVDAKNCLATEVPMSNAKDTLRIVASRLEKLPVRMRTLRPHWERFVAMRVGAADAEAMMPRLTRGAVAVIDRHSSGPSDGSIYLVRVGGHPLLRYVEQLGAELVVRAHDPKIPLAGLGSAAEIVGRVCMVITEV